MSQWVRVFTALAESHSLGSGTHNGWLTTVPGVLIPSFELCGQWTHGVHRHTSRQNTQTHKIKNKNEDQAVVAHWGDRGRQISVHSRPA